MSQVAILPTGPVDSKIMIIGEFPLEQEIKEGKPFVGLSGRVFDELLRQVGIDRDLCYITYVSQHRPYNNNPGEFYEDKSLKTPTNYLEECIRSLEEQIRQVNPNVIIVLGEQAIRATTGLRGIGNWRGSVVKATTGHKTIPTYTPTQVLHEWRQRTAVVCDLTKAKKESNYPEIRQTDRFLEVAYQSSRAIEYLTFLKGEKYVSFDIETESDQVTCIGFGCASRPNWAVCIPFWFGQSGSLHSEESEGEIWGLIRDILEDNNIRKCAQNGMYDIEFLQRTTNIRTCNFSFDTMLAFHVLQLELEKGLGFLVSLYTDHPYYKHQIKSPSMDEYFKYNATDACLTMEIALKLEQELHDEHLADFYYSFVHSLVDPMLDMQFRGIRFDYLRRNTIKKQYQESVAVLQRNLDTMVGRAINVNSPKQMKEWLYGKGEGNLGLKEKTKKRKSTGEVTIAADEEAIKDLYRESKHEGLQIVLKIREKNKLLSTYLETKLDEDKRMRCSYIITGTETGRISSRATLRGTGTNLQNIPDGDIRSLFLPDTGYTLINADLSQAEARVVAYLAGERALIRVFEEGGDIHRKNAANIFKVREEEVTKEQRDMAKRIVHASNYGMGPNTFAKNAGISVADSKKLLNQYFATYPGIVNWHNETKAKVKKTRKLITPFGRVRYFYSRWDESMFKEALAYVPQSTVADLLNQGLLCVYGHKWIELLAQVHDSILVQVPTERVEEAILIIKCCLDVSVDIGGKTLRIPSDFKYGENWADLVKWKGSK